MAMESKSATSLEKETIKDLVSDLVVDADSVSASPNGTTTMVR